MKIGIDLDDVLGNMVPVFMRYHNDTYGTTLTKEDMWSYDFHKVLQISLEESIKRIYDFERSSKLMDIVPIQGAKEAVQQLANKHHLVVITARDDEFAQTTDHWIETHFPGMFSDIYFANHQSATSTPRNKGDICKEIGASLMIDDSFQNALSCYGVCDNVLLFDAPWNKHEKLLDGIHRVSSWEEILQKV